MSTFKGKPRSEMSIKHIEDLIAEQNDIINMTNVPDQIEAAMSMLEEVLFPTPKIDFDNDDRLVVGDWVDSSGKIIAKAECLEEFVRCHNALVASAEEDDKEPESHGHAIMKSIRKMYD